MDKPLFKDIGGYEPQKAEAKKISSFFNNYDFYTKNGATLPNGIIFYGPCGTGKSMFAKAIANEAGKTPYILDGASVFSDKGITNTIKSLFKQAYDNAPSIILIDELDRIVNCETGFQKNESDKQREALRALLTEIDNVKGKGVLVMATANSNIRHIPDALVRNGRIEKHINVLWPDLQDREEILTIYLDHHDCFKNISPKDIAAYTNDLTGSDIAALVNEVLIECLTKNKNAEFNDFIEPIQVIRQSGIKNKMSSIHKPDVIYHEIGHFLADYILSGNMGIINIQPYANTLGHYSPIEMDEILNQLKANSARELKNKAVVCVAGLVATEVFLGEPYLGAASDYKKLVNIYETLLNNGVGDPQSVAINLLSGLDYNSPFQDFRSGVQEDFAHFIVECKDKAREILTSNKNIVDALYKELKDKSILTHVEIANIIKQVKAESKSKAKTKH